MSTKIEPRQGTPDPHLPKVEFERRFLGHFQDAAFETLTVELAQVAAAAWEGYLNRRKRPVPAKQAWVSRIRITTCPSTGSRRVMRSTVLSAASRTCCCRRVFWSSIAH